MSHPEPIISRYLWSFMVLGKREILSTRKVNPQNLSRSMEPNGVQDTPEGSQINWGHSLGSPVPNSNPKQAQKQSFWTQKNTAHSWHNLTSSQIKIKIQYLQMFSKQFNDFSIKYSPPINPQHFFLNSHTLCHILSDFSSNYTTPPLFSNTPLLSLSLGP